VKKNKKFDIREQPIAMGAINSYYGKLKETKRSLSPTHSVIALGENAEYYVSEHHMSETPFTEKSPYFKLLLKKGKILMFGAGIGHLTFYHVLEDMLGDDFPVRVYTKERFEISVIDHKGDSKSGLFKAHNSLAGAYRITDYLNDKLLHLPSTVIIKLGCSNLILLDSIDVILCLLNNFKKGLTIYGKVKISDKSIQKADYWINFIAKLKNNGI